MFRTGPLGRSRGFRFTSFGDQAVSAPVGLGLGPNTPNAGYIVPAVESLDPLFHLFNGDLCYANVSDAPVQTWQSFFTNNTRSAANRPWMPSAGNHENEVGNGPQGYLSYQTRFELPANGSAEFRGNWYAFTVGPIRVISLNNDDVCLQDGAFSAFRRDHVPTYVSSGDNPYINGYSSGAQRAWLEGELARAHQSDDIDWIVVCMHQVAMSSAHFNGADLGIRQQWLPLFEKYGVDLVVAGHEHHFERSFPVRGTLSGSGLLTPAPQSSDPALMDTSNGTVHMIIGGGGHSTPTPVAGFDMPHDGVLITSVGPGSPQSQHPAITTTEPAPWSAYRDLQTPYGFASSTSSRTSLVARPRSPSPTMARRSGPPPTRRSTSSSCASGSAAKWAATSTRAAWPGPQRHRSQPAQPELEPTAGDNPILAAPGIGRWKAKRAVPRSGRTMRQQPQPARASSQPQRDQPTGRAERKAKNRAARRGGDPGLRRRDGWELPPSSRQPWHGYHER